LRHAAKVFDIDDPGSIHGVPDDDNAGPRSGSNRKTSNSKKSDQSAVISVRPHRDSTLPHGYLLG
jgi:hypothetical protein